MARLRHRTFFSLAEFNAAIAELLVELNERPFQGRSESRKTLFEALDRPALKPLPQDDYEYAAWRRAKPGIDYHVEVDKHFYSVPHALVGQILDLRITDPTGCGKIWLACALGNQACRRGLSVRYLRLPTLFEQLRIAHGDGSYPRLMNQLLKMDLLILDDWGIQKITAAADAILDRLLHGAHRLNLRGESMRKLAAELTDRERSA